jgi:tRNA pseudouridine32 synthase/23S rRNA pseudouridine746 synthase
MLSLLHTLTHPPTDPLPKRFNFPHQYRSDPWSKAAAQQLQESLNHRFNHDFVKTGKMFGVLVVETPIGLKYLAGFSGKIDDSTLHQGFVPPIFDTTNPDNFYQQGERGLDALTAKIREISEDNRLQASLHQKKQLEEAWKEQRSAMEKQMATNKLARAQQRKEIGYNQAEEERLNNESKQEQLAFKHAKKKFQGELSQLETNLHRIEQTIQDLKTQRQQDSVNLQEKLFQAYELLNFNGETSTVWEVFKASASELPPSGAGECALPKLLQFAALHGLKPLCFSEFWWGASPIGEVRKHRGYYPACRAKCEPIIAFQLQGLEVEPNPIRELVNHSPMQILFEDAWILAINKPPHMLSVPGRTGFDSVEDRLKLLFPKLAFLKAVHRLDMGTSGVMLFAKNAPSHAFLQRQFASNKVIKYYEALLERTPEHAEGIIELPLRLNMEHRPHQMVCYEHGKKAITLYKKIEEGLQSTRVEFYPKTGRTHQLRVHAAHQLGLNAPILGDELYGTSGERLYLHARELYFQHPNTLEEIHLVSEVPF